MAHDRGCGPYRTSPRRGHYAAVRRRDLAGLGHGPSSFLATVRRRKQRDPALDANGFCHADTIRNRTGVRATRAIGCYSGGGGSRLGFVPLRSGTAHGGGASGRGFAGDPLHLCL